MVAKLALSVTPVEKSVVTVFEVTSPPDNWTDTEEDSLVAVSASKPDPAPSLPACHIVLAPTSGEALKLITPVDSAMLMGVIKAPAAFCLKILKFWEESTSMFHVLLA